VRKNIFDFWNKLPIFIEAHNLRNTYLFSPLYGLGDRTAFYAYLQRFSEQHQHEVAIVQFGADQDALVPYFPFLASRTLTVPDAEVMKPLQSTHWNYGCQFPSPGRVFFTWHRAYLDGVPALSFEEFSKKNLIYNHKNLVKLILNLPLETKPAIISIERNEVAARELSKSILICPLSKTVASPPPDYWKELGIQLARKGYKPVFNVDQNSGIATTTRDSTYDEFEIFSGSIAKLLDFSTHCLLTITARSGMCELLSLASAPFMILTTQDVIPFWSLDNDAFGRSPVLSRSIQKPRMSEDAVELAQWISERF
jgi:hypothetical protein